MKAATHKITNIIYSECVTAAYIKIPQKMPKTKFNHMSLVIRISTIFLAAWHNAGRDQSGIIPTAAEPIKFPNQISKSSLNLIRFYINNPALPVNKAN